MNEDLKLLLDKADTLKGELSALRPLPEDALQKIQDEIGRASCRERVSA